MDSFDVLKQSTMRRLVEDDRSPKGSVDAPIRDLVEFVNSKKDFFTLSSCSGRVSVFASMSEEHVDHGDERMVGKKGSGRWLVVEHREVGADEVFRALEAEGGIWEAVLKAEPFILHVRCRNMECARDLVQLALGAGFRESGCIPPKDEGGGVMVAVRTTSNSLQAPLVLEGQRLLGEEGSGGMVKLVEAANARFRANAARTSRFFEAIREKWGGDGEGKVVDGEKKGEGKSVKRRVTKSMRKAVQFGAKMVEEARSTGLVEWCKGSIGEGDEQWLERWGHCAAGVFGETAVFVHGGFGRGPGRSGQRRRDDAVMVEAMSDGPGGDGGLPKLRVSPVVMRGDTSPGARVKHRMVTLDDKTVVVVGGRKNPDAVCKEVVYIGRLERVEEGGGWVVEWEHVPTDIPPRWACVAAAMQVGEGEVEIVVAGGRDLDRVFDDTWVMRFSGGGRLVRVTQHDPLPAPRTAAAIAVDVSGTGVWMHGGFETIDAVSEPLKLESSSSWIPAVVSASVPPVASVWRWSLADKVWNRVGDGVEYSMASHALVSLPGDARFLALGGAAKHPVASQPAVFDPESVSWKLVGSVEKGIGYGSGLDANCMHRLTAHVLRLPERPGTSAASSVILTIGGGGLCFSFGARMASVWMTDPLEVLAASSGVVRESVVDGCSAREWTAWNPPLFRRPTPEKKETKPSVPQNTYLLLPSALASAIVPILRERELLASPRALHATLDRSKRSAVVQDIPCSLQRTLIDNSSSSTTEKLDKEDPPLAAVAVELVESFSDEPIQESVARALASLSPPSPPPNLEDDAAETKKYKKALQKYDKIRSTPVFAIVARSETTSTSSKPAPTTTSKATASKKQQTTPRDLVVQAARKYAERVLHLGPEEALKLAEEESPRRVERLGDFLVLPPSAFRNPVWTSSGGDGVFLREKEAAVSSLGERGPDLEARPPVPDELLHPQCRPRLDPTFGHEFWRCIAEAAGGCQRMYRHGRIGGDGGRRSTAALLLDDSGPPEPKRFGSGPSGWTVVRQHGVAYELEVTRVMFSKGNAEERGRQGSWMTSGEVVVDLFAGIGYFSIPVLARGGAAKLYACDWNPDAAVCLRANAVRNKVDDRIEVLEGDCRETTRHLSGVADRVLLGLIPSSEAAWPTAVRLLKDRGGRLHVHGNVNIKTDFTSIEAWGEYVAGRLMELAREQKRPEDWVVRVENVERVKSYAPHIYHVVADIVVLGGARSVPATPVGPKVEEHSFEPWTIREIDCSTASPSDTECEAIRAKRHPVVLRSFYSRDETQRFSVDAIATSPEGSKVVSAHVGDASQFRFSPRRTFRFETMPLRDLAERVQKPGPPYTYLRSIGSNPRKDRADVWQDFPSLVTPDRFRFPAPLVPRDNVFSSVLRISSPDMALWTHYDVVDNALVHLSGRKRVLLFPPDAVRFLHLSTSSSSAADADDGSGPSPSFHPNVRSALASAQAIDLHPGDVLFLPSLWLHHVHTYPTDGPGVSLNIFWAPTNPSETSLLVPKDLYGNKDPQPIEEAYKSLADMHQALQNLPPYHRSFYHAKLQAIMETL